MVFNESASNVVSDASANAMRNSCFLRNLLSRVQMKL